MCVCCTTYDNEDNRKFCYVLLVGLATLLLTSCVIYEEAVHGVWKPPPNVVDKGVRVNELITRMPLCVVRDANNHY